jgi:hypothetical protein
VKKLVEVQDLPMKALSGNEVLVYTLKFPRDWVEKLRKIAHPEAYAYRVLATTWYDDNTEFLWTQKDCDRALQLMDGFGAARAQNGPPAFSQDEWEKVRKDAGEGYSAYQAIIQLRTAVDWLIQEAVNARTK